MFHRILFFGWAILVVWNASRIATIPFQEIPHIDKLLHMIFYIPGGYTAFLFIRSFGVKSYSLAFLISSCIAVLDEFIQSLTPHRDPNIFDIFADLIGIILGLFLARLRENLSDTRK